MMPTIGYLGPNMELVDHPRVAAFAQRLGQLGSVEGHSVVIEHRAANGLAERASEIASEFVRLKVDAILTSGDAQGLAAKLATAIIPIVIAIMGEAVGSGLVASLARPGGNVTGLSILQAETAGKQLELLRDIIPGLRRLAILANVANRGAALELKAAEAAAQSLSLDALRLEIRGDEDIPVAIKPLSGHADALYVCVDPLVNSTDRTSSACIDALPIS
jgi:putative tryptophan/tyrosine transport system substrate-binding protein